MSRQKQNRARLQQINILHATTRKRQSRELVTRSALWVFGSLAVLIVTGLGLRLGFNYVTNLFLYQNPRYQLTQIAIEPRGHFTQRVIRQAAGLEPGENLWDLNLPEIAHDLEKLPYVSSAQVERHFPNKVVIRIRERVPIVKIVGLDLDLGLRQTFYLDRECIVLKPRDGEATPLLPEVIGLTNAELEPGVRLEQTSLSRALEILDAIDHSPLHTSIDIHSIDLSRPLAIKMTTTRDMSIYFRLDYLDQQLVRLQQLLDYADNAQKTIRSVDLIPFRNDPVSFYE